MKIWSGRLCGEWCSRYRRDSGFSKRKKIRGRNGNAVPALSLSKKVTEGRGFVRKFSPFGFCSQPE